MREAKGLRLPEFYDADNFVTSQLEKKWRNSSTLSCCNGRRSRLAIRLTVSSNVQILFSYPKNPHPNLTFAPPEDEVLLFYCPISYPLYILLLLLPSLHTPPFANFLLLYLPLLLFPFPGPHFSCPTNPRFYSFPLQSLTSTRFSYFSSLISLTSPVITTHFLSL